MDVRESGCPYRCSYCNQPFFEDEYNKEYTGTRKSDFFRFKSVDRLIEEILEVKNIAKMKRVHFSNDALFPNTDWLKEFAEKHKFKKSAELMIYSGNLCNKFIKFERM